MPADVVTSLNPWHIVLVLDDSGSMAGEPAKFMNDGLRYMIDELEGVSMGKKPYFRVSIISFGSRPKTLSEARREQDIDVDAIAQFNGDSGSTDAASALSEAAALLRRNPGVDTDFTPYVFFFSDGHPDNENMALRAADELKNLSIPAGTPHVVSIGLGNVNDSFMKSVATNSELFIHLRDPAQLSKLWPRIGSDLARGQTGSEGVDERIRKMKDDDSILNI